MLKLDPSSHCDVCLDEFTSDEFDVHAPHSAPCGELTLSAYSRYCSSCRLGTLNDIARALGHVACLDCFRRTALFAHEDGLKCPLCAVALTEGDIRKLQVQIGAPVAGLDLGKRRSQASVSGSKRPPSTLTIEAMMLETRVAKLLATAMTRQMTKAEVDEFIKVERDADTWLETACRGNHALRVSHSLTFTLALPLDNSKRLCSFRSLKHCYRTCASIISMLRHGAALKIN